MGWSVNDALFMTVKNILDWVNVLFVLYMIGYSTFLFLAVVIGSSDLYKKRQQEKLKNTLLQDYYIPISIVVPGYNEEVTVVETVRSLLALKYRLYEIIVVNDGSKDATSQKLIDAFHMHPIRRPIHRKIPCQPEEFIYETTAQKVPLTLIRKKTAERQML